MLVTNNIHLNNNLLGIFLRGKLQPVTAIIFFQNKLLINTKTGKKMADPVWKLTSFQR